MQTVEHREQLVVNPYLERAIRRFGDPFAALGQEISNRLLLLSSQDLEKMIRGEGENPMIKVSLFGAEARLILERFSSKKGASTKLLFLKGEPSGEAREWVFKFVTEAPVIHGIDSIEMTAVTDQGRKWLKVLEFRHSGNIDYAWLMRTRLELEDGAIVRARQDVRPGAYKEFQQGARTMAFLFRAVRPDGKHPNQADYIIAPLEKGTTTLSRSICEEQDYSKLIRALENVTKFIPAV